MATFNLKKFLSRVANNNTDAVVRNEPTTLNTNANPLDGEKNDQAAIFVNKIISDNCKTPQGDSLFSDEGWAGVHHIWEAFDNAGLDWQMTGAHYQNSSSNPNGMPTSKIWKIEVYFKNNNGIETALVGNITAHGAGPVSDPLKQYGITGYVSAVRRSKLGATMPTFNLQKQLNKIASESAKLTKLANEGAGYEGAQGYFISQTRAWQNCSRMKMLKGASAQEAWLGCLEEYQKINNNIEWVGKYCVEDHASLQKQAQSLSPVQMGSYWEKIKKHRSQGMTVGQSVMAALKDCEFEAKKIHESKNKTTIKTAEKQKEKDSCSCCGCGNHGNSHECKCPPDCKCRKDGGTCKKIS